MVRGGLFAFFLFFFWLTPSPALAHDCSFCGSAMAPAQGEAWYASFRCRCGATLQVFSDGSKSTRRGDRVVIEDVPRPEPAPAPRDDRLEPLPVQRPGLPVARPAPPVRTPGLPVVKPGLPVLKPGLPILRPGRVLGARPRDNRYWTVQGRVFSSRTYRPGRARVYSRRRYGEPRPKR